MIRKKRLSWCALGAAVACHTSQDPKDAETPSTTADGSTTSTSSNAVSSTSSSPGTSTGSGAATGGSDAFDSSAGGTKAGGGTGAAGPNGGGSSLSERYPGDEGIADDPSVLFHDDFEQGWGRWDSPQADTDHVFLETDASRAHAGSGFLRSTVTTADLAENEYISSASRFDFSERVERVYWRFYAWFEGIAPNPHHWVRMSAGTEAYQSSGLANTVPSGDEGFWFDLDADNDDVFNFYAYWYKMRSGRCNDGTAVEGCEGDQGTTYYYGNVFRPEPQSPFERNAWTCIEVFAKANALGGSDGELALWVNDELVGEYRPGEPLGTWLRAQFHTGGCDFSACTEPVPFEGFDFRSNDDVLFKAIILDAYYERGSSADKKAELEGRGLTVSDSQTIFYDDVVVASERIGCRVD